MNEVRVSSLQTRMVSQEALLNALHLRSMAPPSLLARLCFDLSSQKRCRPHGLRVSRWDHLAARDDGAWVGCVQEPAMDLGAGSSRPSNTRLPIGCKGKKMLDLKDQRTFCLKFSTFRDISHLNLRLSLIDLRSCG
jgi:hypothetical protein